MTHLRYMLPEKPSNNSGKGEAHFCCHTNIKRGSTIAASHAANALPMLVTSEQFKSVADPTERSNLACDLLKRGGNLPPVMSMYAPDDFSKVEFEHVHQSRWEAHTGQKWQNDHPYNWSNAASGRVALVSAWSQAIPGDIT
jgi:hypothetical protein